MDFWLIFALIFVIGTVILARTKVERHFIVFLIRTRHFLKFIDNVASIAPYLWKFIADFAIIFSFSGIGAAYLSKYRKLSKNLDIILILVGLLTISVWWQNVFISLLFVIVLLIGVKKLHELNNITVDFIVATALISLIWLKNYPWYFAMFEGMFGLIVLIFAPLIENAFAIASGESSTPGVSPLILIPIKEYGRWCFPIPGMGICIPALYAVVSIAILLVVHEFSHGVLTRVHGLKLKSTGLLTLGPLPLGAFVEPDEEDFKKSRSIIKTRILVVGSFSNLILSLVAISIFSFITLSPQVVIEETSNPYLTKGSIIQAIDGKNITLSVSTVYLFPNQVYPIEKSTLNGRDVVNVSTSDSTFLISVEEITKTKIKPLLVYRYNYYLYGVNIFEILVGILFWSFFFNLNIGLVNILPIPPFDGGKLLPELISTFRVDEITAKKIAYVVILIGLLIIIVNALPLINYIL